MTIDEQKKVVNSKFRFLRNSFIATILSTILIIALVAAACLSHSLYQQKDDKYPDIITDKYPDIITDKYPDIVTVSSQGAGADNQWNKMGIYKRLYGVTRNEKPVWKMRGGARYLFYDGDNVLLTPDIVYCNIYRRWILECWF